MVSGVPGGLLTLILTFALALLTEDGVNPNCLAIDIAEDLLTAESKNISFNNILPR